MEYNDKENFNWSCRTHPSEWGGTVWWCCGKSDKSFPGCKFSRHVSKDDQEDPDDDPFGNGTEGTLNAKLKRCACCKQQGHSAENCAHDPNLRTTTDISEDEIRILTT